MKKGTHPKYMKCDVICNCGENRGVLFTTRSTVPQIKVEICSFCHPYFTGKQKIMDTAGRVDKFNKKLAKRKVKTEEVKTEEVKAEEVKAEEVKAVKAEVKTEDVKTEVNVEAKAEEVKTEEVKTEEVKTEEAVS